MASVFPDFSSASAKKLISVGNWYQIPFFQNKIPIMRRVVCKFFFCCLWFRKLFIFQSKSLFCLKLGQAIKKVAISLIESFLWSIFWSKSDLPNNTYTTLLNMELSQNVVPLFLLWSLQKDFEVMKNIKIMKFEEDCSIL